MQHSEVIKCLSSRGMQQRITKSGLPVSRWSLESINAAFCGWLQLCTRASNGYNHPPKKRSNLPLAWTDLMKIADFKCTRNRVSLVLLVCLQVKSNYRVSYEGERKSSLLSGKKKPFSAITEYLSGQRKLAPIHTPKHLFSEPPSHSSSEGRHVNN